jgi:hypothetical protein
MIAGAFEDPRPLHRRRLGCLPFDMLRYDCCWPEEESDGPNVGMMYDNTKFI